MRRKIRIQRIDPTLPLPQYETEGAVGFDLLCREAVTIPPRTVGRIPANVIVETPPGYMLLVTLRSSTPRKYGLLIPHGVGVIDNDYCGEGDEIQIQVFNFTDVPVEIERGSRVAQGIFVRIGRAEWEEVEEISRQARGGFGSTDDLPFTPAHTEHAHGESQHRCEHEGASLTRPAEIPPE